MADVTGTDVVANLTSVRERLAAVQASLPAEAPAPALIAVSKTKPSTLLQAAYDAGQRDFGENYVQEVVAKGPELPTDLRWHFIGHLQSNKVKELVSVPNLFCVHTVDSIKLAGELQKRVAAMRPDRPLEVMVQVNTSGEESKSGCTPADCAAICVELVATCPQLVLRGLMCIGKYSSSEGVADEDFAVLAACRLEVAGKLQRDPAVRGCAFYSSLTIVPTLLYWRTATAVTCLAATTYSTRLAPQSIGLSMGMSHDFEVAARAGATYVRVGSTIFGARAPKPST